jgi:hypothetical protein
MEAPPRAQRRSRRFIIEFRGAHQSRGRLPRLYAPEPGGVFAFRKRNFALYEQKFSRGGSAKQKRRMMQVSMAGHEKKSEKQRRAEFDQLLFDLGGDNNEKRLHADLRLQQIPLEERVERLKAFCDRDETQKNAALLWSLMTITPVFLIVLLRASIVQRNWLYMLWLLCTVVMHIILSPLYRRWQIPRQPATEGAIHLLLRLHQPELTPALVQMLPYLQARRNGDDPLYQTTLEILARRLPEYQAADLASLTRKERNELQKQVERLMARLDHFSPPLTEAEANFMIAALNILHPSGDEQSARQLSQTKAVQRLTGSETRKDLSKNWRFVAEAVQEQVVAGQTRK